MIHPHCGRVNCASFLGRLDIQTWEDGVPDLARQALSGSEHFHVSPAVCVAVIRPGVGVVAARSLDLQLLMKSFLNDFGHDSLEDLAQIFF
jgi:hypothetical protein